MKKNIFTLLVILVPFIIKAQIRLDLNGTINREITYQIGNITTTIEKGTSVSLKSILKENGVNKAQIKDNDKNILFSTSIKYLSSITFKPNTINQFWQKQALTHEVYNNIATNGIQYELRKELEAEAIDYLSYVESNNLIFEDRYLETYLYALANKIYPTRIGDGAAGALSVKVLKSTTPKAFIYSDGTMFLTTGLLSVINSEEELVAVMAHEVAHFVLDHAIININQTEKRIKRAKFWANFATGVAAAADIYTAANNEYYTPGAITAGTAILAHGIAYSLNKRMGIAYSLKQQLEADKCASELMKFINSDPTALASTLLKIKKHSALNGNYLNALTETVTHPAIDNRVNILGKPSKNFINPKYDITISSVNTFNAIIYLNNNDLQTCLDLVNRNIRADIATEDDYILLAMVTNFMFNNKEKNNQAYEYIKKAKSLDILPSINLHKQEALVLIRLDRYEEAKVALAAYNDALKDEYDKFKYLKNTREWTKLNNLLFNEKEWAIKMAHKLNHL